MASPGMEGSSMYSTSLRSGTLSVSLRYAPEPCGRASGRTLLAACLLVATKSRTVFTVAASGSALPCGASASRVDSAVSSAGGSVPFFCSSACAGNAVKSAKQKQIKRRLKMDRGMMLSDCIKVVKRYGRICVKVSKSL